MSWTERAFEASDYEAARALWAASEGVGHGPGDSEEGVHRFLHRNPGLSFVAASFVAAAAGFFVHNAPKARIFLGDAGSTVLGFTFDRDTARAQLEAAATERRGMPRRLRLALANDGRLTLTQAAHRAGFADSAHLTRTCKQLTGVRPAQMMPRTVHVES